MAVIYVRAGLFALLLMAAVLRPVLAAGAEQTAVAPPLLVPVDQLDGIQRATVILDSYVVLSAIMLPGTNVPDWT